MGCRPRAQSVLHCHLRTATGSSDPSCAGRKRAARRHEQFRRWQCRNLWPELCRTQVSCKRTQASWELVVQEAKQMEDLKLVSSQLRKWRLALWAFGCFQFRKWRLPQIIVDTQCFATFLPFRHLHRLSSDPFSSLIFLLLLCSSLTPPISAFPSVPLVRSLTSKLPLLAYILDVLLRWESTRSKRRNKIAHLRQRPLVTQFPTDMNLQCAGVGGRGRSPLYYFV